MAYEGGLSAPHHVVIEERKSLTVSGVEDVERFDENTIVLSTSKGAMVVTGENLHIVPGRRRPEGRRRHRRRQL